MYLKLVGILQAEPDNHIYEADHFRWGWREIWPDEYVLPFPIGDGEHSHVLTVDIFEGQTVKETLVVFDAICYLMNARGSTIEKFTT